MIGDNERMPIRSLSPHQARARQRAGALLVDVRAAHERALGMADGALGIVREDLQADPAAHLPDIDALQQPGSPGVRHGREVGNAVD